MSYGLTLPAQQLESSPLTQFAFTYGNDTIKISNQPKRPKTHIVTSSRSHWRTTIHNSQISSSATNWEILSTSHLIGTQSAFSMTSLDRALQSKNAVLAFGGLVAAITAWTIWKDAPLFPPMADPSGDPKQWTLEELRNWLHIRKLHPDPHATREELLERVRLNLAPQ